MSDEVTLFEVCVDSVMSAVTAEDGGASRIELCANLGEGGTTPSSGMITAVLKRVKIPVMVMIRPRGGDFCYSEEEFEVMRLDLEHVKKLSGVYGVVFGILKPDGSVDVERVTKLVEIAKPLKVTFHRAFDMTNDHLKALHDIIRIGGIQRILTSGHDTTVLEGLETIKELLKHSGDHIIIMPGGGVRESNISRILSSVQLKEIHVSASTKFSSSMEHKITNIHMGKALYDDEYLVGGVCKEKLMGMINAAATIKK
ncbi:7688_t:CDS:10 [Acaulospora morrowiae]|uniref:Copper homeostasis protein cutC homolog n=1 Tax=Acaulospora morrowiae TaxID=94023 RepID=A0A9N9B5T8_9GLOM|nr:7688_t:CDS:10 [Acaulospora morrowiae]